MHPILEMVYDRSPRQVYHFLRRKWLKQTRHSLQDIQPCIFVLSTGRVGTETLAALFALSNAVFSHHEPTPKLFGLSKVAYENMGSQFSTPVLNEAFLTARTDLLDYSAMCNKGYIETSPQTTFLAPAILNALPQTRFIHLVRDPRDVIRSGMRRKWFSGNPADPTRITPLPTTSEAQEWDTYNPFQKNLWLWTETNRWIQNFCATIPSQSILLRSEELFSQQPAQIESLFKFAGLPVPSARKIHNILGKKMNAQQGGDFPLSSQWTTTMNQELQAVAGSLARSFGYTLA